MSSVTNVASDEAIAEEAYARVKGDWESLTQEELLQVNLDPHFAAETVLGAWARLKGHRDRIAKDIPTVDIQLIDKLQDYVLALQYVQSRYVMATKDEDDLQLVAEQANKLCDILEADAKTLSLRGLFDPIKLHGLQGGNSYKGLASDLQALANELKAIFPTIQGKCATTLEDLKTANQLAVRLTRLRGEEHISPAEVAAVTEERQRAFTQLIRAYDEARAAVAFLRRREDDADQITPNVYLANTRRRRSVEEPAVAPATATPAPVQPATPAASEGLHSPPPGASPSTSRPFLT